MLEYVKAAGDVNEGIYITGKTLLSLSLFSLSFPPLFLSYFSKFTLEFLE